MPTEHFKSPEAYRRWTAYRHIHGIAAPHLKTAVIAGKAHKVMHSEKGETQKEEAKSHSKAFLKGAVKKAGKHAFGKPLHHKEGKALKGGKY